MSDLKKLNKVVDVIEKEIEKAKKDKNLDKALAIKERMIQLLLSFEEMGVNITYEDGDGQGIIKRKGLEKLDLDRLFNVYLKQVMNAINLKAKSEGVY